MTSDIANPALEDEAITKATYVGPTAPPAPARGTVQRDEEILPLGPPPEMLPFQPLEEAIRGGLPRHDPLGCGCQTNGPRIVGVCMTEIDIAAVLHRHPKQVNRWRKGGVSVDLAYELADLARTHPWIIWPELRAAVEAEKRQREEDQRERNRKSSATRMRRSYQKDPEQFRARSRAYYQECAEYVKARERRRYRDNADVLKAKAAERYRANHEANLERKRAYYEANKEAINAKSRAYRERKKAERNGEAA